MSQTVIGFFDDASEAQKAVQRLQSSGFNKNRIDVSNSGGTSATSGSHGSPSSHDHVNPVSGSERDENSVRRTADDRTVDREGRNTNKITDFFNNLFGGKDDDDDAKRYSHVGQRSSIVTVHAQSKDEAERAADILDECGAVDVDERAEKSGYTGSAKSNIQGTSERSGSTYRSRIVDRSVDDHLRLRDTNHGTDSNSLNDDLSTKGI